MSGTWLLLGLVLTSSPAAPEPPSDEQLLARAEAEFHSGRETQADSRKVRAHLAEAAACYETLRQRGYHSAALFLNQGNANLLAGNLPQAILSYRRGLRLAPGDLSLLVNLTAARDEVAYPAPGSFGRPPKIIWPLGLPPVPPELPWKLAIVLYFVFWYLAVPWLMLRRTFLLMSAVGVLLAIAFLVAYVVIEVCDSRGEEQRPLVVVARDGVVLRKGNALSYPPRNPTPLNRGVEAQQLFTRGNWLQIRLAGGEVGWVPRADVLVDTD